MARADARVGCPQKTAFRSRLDIFKNVNATGLETTGAGTVNGSDHVGGARDFTGGFHDPDVADDKGPRHIIDLRPV
jgi:hypothetical protein